MMDTDGGPNTRLMDNTNSQVTPMSYANAAYLLERSDSNAETAKLSGWAQVKLHNPVMHYADARNKMDFTFRYAHTASTTGISCKQPLQEAQRTGMGSNKTQNNLASHSKT
jgi:hypothetical protein